ncbi:MAG: substrate-binding domain-containing protein [Lachnospiraceae bacterium]|nr:substrate-binding domain-containing protein [Lachnospiraceae bacterium]
MNTEAEKNKKVTVADIAALAGVSPATVSRVLNRQGIVKEETVSRVMEAVKHLEYPWKEPSVPAPCAPSGELVVMTLPSFSNSFYDAVIKGAQTSVMRHGHSLLIHEGHIHAGTIEPFLKMIQQNSVAGLITLNHIDTPLLKKLAGVVSLVQCCEYNEELDLPYVSIDDVSAAKYAVDHLIARGRRRIAFINAPLRYKYARHRLEGYLQALREAGLPIVNDYIIQLPEIDSDLVTSATLRLLGLSAPPDAVFTISDLYGAAVLRACHLSGRSVPEQVAVVGFDNLETAKIMIPSLTSVNQPKIQLGFMAAELLMEQFTDKHSPVKKILLETELIVRESSSL